MALGCLTMRYLDLFYDIVCNEFYEIVYYFIQLLLNP
jgi:hypothetical protein